MEESHKLCDDGIAWLAGTCTSKFNKPSAQASDSHVCACVHTQEVVSYSLDQLVDKAVHYLSNLTALSDLSGRVSVLDFSPLFDLRQAEVYSKVFRTGRAATLVYNHLVGHKPAIVMPGHTSIETCLRVCLEEYGYLQVEAGIEMSTVFNIVCMDVAHPASSSFGADNEFGGPHRGGQAVTLT